MYEYTVYEYFFECSCGIRFTLEGKEVPNAYCPECQEKVKLINERMLRIERKSGKHG